jgi:AraC family transcriptional regulator of adaptative response/methylated-DNA-[protein]-cysteine methyltransferase
MTTLTLPHAALATDLRFATGECDLGAILVAWGERGLSAIELGDHREGLRLGFEARHRDALYLENEPEVASLIEKVAGFVENPVRGLDLPLDVKGTEFERRVWSELRQVPAGERVSYGELARRIGAPTSVRAVARACAANRLAVAIPCHRVVGHDGALTGYRWGIDRKRELLARESGESVGAFASSR